MNIRVLTAADAEAYRQIRLHMLREHPEAFGSSYEEYVKTPLEAVVGRFRTQWNQPNNFILGAEESGLVGTIGFHQDKGVKTHHWGIIWGVYTAPEVRGRGVGRTLMLETIARARALPDLEQISLAVVTSNHAARALYDAVGFQVWGVEPRALKVGDQYYDEEHRVLNVMRNS